MHGLNAYYAVTSEPAVEPLTLSDLKDRLRVTVCDFDTELGQLLKAGRKQVEQDSMRKLVTQTVALYMDAFPSGNTIEIRQVPVASVTSVQYVDEDVATQTFSSALYTTDLTSKPARIMLLENQDWKDTEPEYPKAVTVTFVAGAAVASVPVEAKLAIIEWCKMHWGDCDGDNRKYLNLINTLAWTGFGKVVS